MFLGIAYDIDQGMVFYVLKENIYVVCRSTIAPFSINSNSSESIKEYKTKTNGNIHKTIGGYGNHIINNEQVNKKYPYGDNLFYMKLLKKSLRVNGEMKIKYISTILI